MRATLMLSLALTAATLPAAVARAQGPKLFYARQDFRVGEHGYSVAVGDFGDDGLHHLAVPSRSFDGWEDQAGP